MSLTIRQEIARSDTSVPPITWSHTPATGKPPGPDTAFAFTADAGTDQLTTTAGDNPAIGERVRLVNSGGGLPAPLAAATDYYVLANFKLSATLGGSAINITTAGTGTHTWQRYLTADELAEVTPYLAFWSRSTGAALPPDPTLASAIVMVNAWHTYWRSAAYMTWWHDDNSSRDKQWKHRQADIFIATEETVAISSTGTGSGSGAPVSPIAAAPPEPQAESVQFNIITGTQGSAITLEPFSDTPGAVVYFRMPKGTGSWITYLGTPVSMSAGQFLEAYCTAPGFTQSEITEFENA